MLTTARHCFKCLAYINLFYSQDNSMTSMSYVFKRKKKKSNHTTEFPWLAGGRALTVPV